MSSGPSVQSEVPSAQPKPQRAMLPALLLLAAIFAVYSPVNHYDFADVDDDAYISNNLHIKYGLDWDGVKWAFTTYYLANWHPVTWMSHALDCQYAGLNAGRQHNVNVALHGLDAIVLFWVLLSATGFAGRSAMVAALLALHPINVESVVWIAERKNVLSMLFFLLTLGAYRWYATNPRVGRYLLVAFLFALGLMSKPQVITLPFVLLLWDYWPLRRMFPGAGDAPVGTSPGMPFLEPKRFSWLVLEKLPLLLLSAGSAVLTVKAQRSGGAMNSLNSFALGLRVENAIVSYARYMGKAVWPSHLSAFYNYPRYGIDGWQLGWSCVLLIAVTALVMVYRERRWLPVGWFWFLGTLVPMIGLVQVGDQSMADRYAYLPLVGLFIMVCWQVADFASHWIGSTKSTTAWLAAPSLAILLALTIATRRQIGYWENSVALWSHAVQVTRLNDAAETYLGEALIRAANPRAAIPHLQRAVAIFPAGPKAYMFLGYAEQQMGQPRSAIQHFQRTLDLSQNYGADAARIRQATLQSMAFAYRDIGDYARASQCLEAAQQMSQP